LIRTIRMGNRLFVPSAEIERIEREGIGAVTAGRHDLDTRAPAAPRSGAQAPAPAAQPGRRRAVRARAPIGSGRA
jgi:hypothetical protein